jgi:predicted permease
MPAPSLLRRTLAYLSRSRHEDDLREEIEAHIAQRRNYLIDEGMDPRDAEYEARRMFGNVTVIREETRDMWSFHWLDTLGQDLRYGIRLLRKSPVFTVAAIGSLALGIGSAAAVFSLTDALMLRTLPVHAPRELVLFRWSSGPQAVFESLNGNGTMNETELSSTSFSRTAYDTMHKALAQDVELFGFADIYRANLAIDGRPETGYGQVVTGNYFQVLGISPAAGRLLGPADDRRDAPPAAVLGYDLWMKRFGGSQDVIGHQLVLNGVSFTIAGVLPRGFNGTLQVAQPCDVIVPMALYAEVTHAENNIDDPNYWWVLMMGRLKQGAPVERVQNAADAILKQTVAAAKQDLKPDALPRVSVELGHRGQTETRSGLVEPLQIMAGVVGVVLLVACANVANLLLARGKARARELAVRAAIGAPRRRIVRQLLTVGLLLGVIASVIGLVLAGWITSALVPALSTDSATFGVTFALDWRILAFTCLLALLCSVGFGLAPALRSSDAHITTGLQESSRGAVGSRRRFSAAGTLVVAQVALSMLLVSAAGLLAWSAYKLQRVELGFDPNNLLTFSVDTTLNGYDEARRRAFVDASLEALRAVPGVQGASVSSHRLIANSSSIGMARAAGTPAPLPGSREVMQWGTTHRAYRLNVDDRFLETMRMPLLRGRSFSTQDSEESPPVGVINVALANQLFGTADAVGKRMIMGLRPGNPEVEVIGVVGNAMYTSIRSANLPIAYFPVRQEPLHSMTFEVRTAGEPLLLTSAVRDALRRLDATLPIFDVRTQQDQILRSLERERLFAQLAILLGTVTLVLSGIGLYGLLAYAVTRRTPEIGVRMALGAERGQVRWMILRQSLVLVAAGLALGIPGAAAASSLVESLLFGLNGKDPKVLVCASLIMLAVGLLAAYVPARRASRIDPLSALRAE